MQNRRDRLKLSSRARISPKLLSVELLWLRIAKVRGRCVYLHVELTGSSFECSMARPEVC